MFDANLELTAGATFDFDLTWVTKDEKGNIEPVKLVGAQAEFEIRTRSGELLVRCSSDQQNIKIPDPDTGQIFINISPLQTTDAQPEQWRDAIWGVLVTFSSMDRYPIAEGSATLKRKVVYSQI